MGKEKTLSDKILVPEQTIKPDSYILTSSIKEFIQELKKEADIKIQKQAKDTSHNYINGIRWIICRIDKLAGDKLK